MTNEQTVLKITAGVGAVVLDARRVLVAQGRRATPCRRGSAGGCCPGSRAAPNVRTNSAALKASIATAYRFQSIRAGSRRPIRRQRNIGRASRPRPARSARARRASATSSQPSGNDSAIGRANAQNGCSQDIDDSTGKISGRDCGFRSVRAGSWRTRGRPGRPRSARRSGRARTAPPGSGSEPVARRDQAEEQGEERHPEGERGEGHGFPHNSGSSSRLCGRLRPSRSIGEHSLGDVTSQELSKWRSFAFRIALTFLIRTDCGEKIESASEPPRRHRASCKADCGDLHDATRT